MEWPQEIFDGESEPPGEFLGENPMSDHHDLTKIMLSRESEWAGYIYGHGSFISENKCRGKKIEFLAKSGRVLIENYRDLFG